jgi:transcriptional regulator with XRE-family HTH domain
MVSQDLKESLDRYCLGEKLHHLRLRKKLGLAELSRSTGLSPAMLSKLENGKLYPTLPTLMRIATAFSVGFSYFFSEEKDRRSCAIARKKDRIRFPEDPSISEIAYEFESLDFPAIERRFNTYLAEFRGVRPDRIRLHQHPGVEFIYVVRGRLNLRIGSVDEVLETGDSIHFDSQIPHGYMRAGPQPCSAIVVTTG